MEESTIRPIKRIGIDMGHVIMDGANDGSETDFLKGPNYLNARATARCFEVIEGLVDKYGIGNVVVVSKCGPNTERRTLEWFEHNGFYVQTGVLPADIHFCRQIEEKGPICVRLELDAFIDDRLGVHFYIHQSDPGVIQILFGDQERDRKRFAHHLEHVIVAPDWGFVEHLLL